MTVLFSHYVPAEMPTPMAPAPTSPPVAPEQAPVPALAMPQPPMDSFTPMMPSQPPANSGMPALTFGKKPAPKIHDAIELLKRLGAQTLQPFKPQG